MTISDDSLREKIGKLCLGTDPDGKDYCLKDAKDVYRDLMSLIEAHTAEAVREAEERRKIMFPEDYEDLFVAIERWSREGRTEEQVHGATNFITSRHFPKSHLTQSTKESEDGWKKGTLYKS